MLFALRYPVAFVGLAIGFVVGVVAHVVLQAYAARWVGLPTAVEPRRRRPTVKDQLDPFGVVAAALGGVGWGALPTLRTPWRRAARGRLVTVGAAGVLANLALAAIALAVLAVMDGHILRELADGTSLPGAFQGGLWPTSAGERILQGFALENLAMAVLTVLPLPPLECGQLVFAFGPRSVGWQKAEYYLVENNWGLGVLVLLSLPISNNVSLMARLLDAIVHPLLSAAASLQGG